MTVIAQKRVNAQTAPLKMIYDLMASRYQLNRKGKEPEINGKYN